MLFNYLKIAYRNLTKKPVFSLINVLGLSLGMTAFLLIFQYLSFEASVNQFHQNSSSIYRVLVESKQGETQDYTSPVLASRLKHELGEVKNFCRVAQEIGNGIVTVGESSLAKSFKEEKVIYADGSFFDLFSFPIKEGSGQSLKETNTVAVSESTAKKYFNTQSALGQVISLNNQFGKGLYKIVAVYADFPANSDLQYDLIFSLATFQNPSNLNGNDWASLEATSSFLTTYLQLENQSDPKSAAAKATTIWTSIHAGEEGTVRLQSLKYMHLPESLDDHYASYGNLKFVYLLGSVATLILVIAWLNYINLSTAGALKRAKEVGVRKVVGASKSQLVFQFLSESFLLNACGFLLALAFINLFQGVFNDIVGKSLSMSILKENGFWIAVLLLLSIGSFASGGYTAFVLSSFKASNTLKGAFSKSIKGIALRKSLVVFQFSISILLIASTFILYQQVQFMKTTDIGMNVDQLLIIPGPQIGKDSTYKQRTISFKNGLTQASFIQKVSSTGGVPTEGYNFSTTNITRLNPMPGDEKLNYTIIEVDDQFFDTYEIQLIAGQNFTEETCRKKWSEVDKLILNESAIRQLGFESPEKAIGQKIKWETEFEIVGVSKDYHHLSLQQSIAPTIYFPRYNSHFFTIKLQSENMKDRIAYVEKLYREYFPGNPFEFVFASDNYNRQYQTEQQYSQVFSIASGLAIFIACLGLFGLATFTVEQRTKEIGIRKVLGASVFRISTLLSKDFLILVFIAIVIATPISWWAMDQWLQNFAYHIEISWWFFAVAGFMAIGIAIITVSWQSIQAATSNPVNSLRNE